MLTYQIKTFGCQMNYSDSERVANLLEQNGFEKITDKNIPDLIIVNTCSVRQKSEDKAYGFMVNLKKEFPQTKIAVTGCMVRQTGDKNTSKDNLLKYDPIDFVFRIEDTARLPKILEPYFPNHNWGNFANFFGTGSLENYFNINPKVENKSQVFVPIMQGCDKFCTYCIVPYTRGLEVSRPMKDILSECEKLVENGAVEITLLGQNVNSYRDGKNGEKCFAKLLLEVDKFHKKGLSRLRFTSAHPQDFTDDVIESLSKMETSCPYVHLPVQHGANSMLRKMNRNYQIEKFEKIIAKIREKIPNCTIATDIIVGFPGETEEEFKTLQKFAKKMEFDFSYTAIFSPRRNTPAWRMKDQFINKIEKKKRFAEFDKIIKKSAWKNREEAVGKVLEILVEKSVKQKDGMFLNSGRSREYFEVYFFSGRELKGQEVFVKIKDRDGYVFKGELENFREISTSQPKISLSVVV